MSRESGSMVLQGGANRLQASAFDPDCFQGVGVALHDGDHAPSHHPKVILKSNNKIVD
jgi:hypothetical protein